MTWTKAAVAAVLMAAACNGGGGGDPDAAASDGAIEAVDAGADAGLDRASDDATVDAAVAALADATVDAIPDAPCPVTLATGVYLLGVDLGFTVPTTAQFLVTVDYHDGEGCSGTFAASIQPLTQGTRVPTGDPIVSRDVPIDAGGAFVLPVAGVVPADASPIPTPIRVEGELTGAAHGDGACGTFSALVDILPARLEGPFAMVPVDPAAPLPPAQFRCPTP